MKAERLAELKDKHRLHAQRLSAEEVAELIAEVERLQGLLGIVATLDAPTVDSVLDRWDQTEPPLQRQIVAVSFANVHRLQGILKAIGTISFLANNGIPLVREDFAKITKLVTEALES